MALTWEELPVEQKSTGIVVKNVDWAKRAKVPGGWLVAVGIFGGGGVTFYPDPKHEWDGRSLP
jgi:hypothetical protein